MYLLAYVGSQNGHTLIHSSIQFILVCVATKLIIKCALTRSLENNNLNAS